MSATLLVQRRQFRRWCYIRRAIKHGLHGGERVVRAIRVGRRRGRRSLLPVRNRGFSATLPRAGAELAGADQGGDCVGWERERVRTASLAKPFNISSIAANGSSSILHQQLNLNSVRTTYFA